MRNAISMSSVLCAWRKSPTFSNTLRRYIEKGPGKTDIAERLSNVFFTKIPNVYSADCISSSRFFGWRTRIAGTTAPISASDSNFFITSVSASCATNESASRHPIYSPRERSIPKLTAVHLPPFGLLKKCTLECSFASVSPIVSVESFDPSLTISISSLSCG